MLFRQEALDAQSTMGDLIGQPTGVVPIAWFRITALLTCFMIALAAFLMTANFSRKETVRGKLRPLGAEARVYALEAGIITEVLTKDDALIEAGTPLVKITADRVFSDGKRLSEEDLTALKVEHDLVSRRIDGLKESVIIAEADIDQRRNDAVRRVKHGQEQLALVQDRFATAQRRLEDTKGFLSEGLVTSLEYMERQDDVSLLQQSNLQVQAEVAEAEAEQLHLEIERRRVRSDWERDNVELQQRLVQIESQLRQTEANTTHVVAAPITGQVSALQARLGERADPSVPLLTVGPPDSDLVAELYLPSRAIAFVEPGQTVKLQYDALPYQKFGIAEGKVIRISSTSLLPQELGVVTQAPEPLYRIEVRLLKQHVRAFNRDIPLQSGMELTADIVLENRKLFEWLLEPLKSVR